LRSLPRLLLLTASLLPVFLLVDSRLTAEEADLPATESQEEIIQSILELRQQIEDLLEILPEDVRQEVEQRWRERQAEKPEDTDAAAELTPESGPESEPVIDRQTASEAEPIVEDENSSAEELVAETAPPCGGFHWFDTNQDSLVSGGDRQWRHLRLWFDNNGDGELEDAEIESLFELGVRQIDVGLRFYNNDEGDSEDVDVDDLIRLQRVGKGGANRRSGALVVAAERLARDGRSRLTDTEGTQLSGYQTLGSTTVLETSDGKRSPVLCQESE